MSTEERLKSLFAKLIEATRDGHLQWSPTADEAAFRVTFQSGNISIKKDEGYDPEEMQSYLNRSLSVFNEKGRLIEEYVPSYVEATIEEFDELFTLARRSAFNTDDVLAQLMGEIASKVHAKR
jgi:hypothetical protein